MQSKNFHILLIFLTLFLIINTGIPAQDHWQKLNSPTNELLRNLSAVDENYVWAAGTNGTIIRTTNGGKEWETLNTGVTTAIYDVFFLDRNLGWAVTFPFEPPYYTGILKTTNGGDNWQIQQYPEEFIQFRTIHFLDSLNGFVGGVRIEKTSDGGGTWQRVIVDSNEVSDYPVIRFKFFDNQLGFASGGSRDHAGVMWRTTNGGFKWTAESVSPDEVFDFHLQDSLNIVALSGDPEYIFPTVLVKSTNAGADWISTNLQLFFISWAIDFRNVNEAWSASGINFLFSSDGGDNWSVKETPDSAAVFDIQFVNDTVGFACGQDGVILKYTGSTVNIDDEPIILIENFELYQNYPNPFNPSTTISYQIPEESNVSLKVYNLLGSEVAVLVNEEKPAGIYEVEFISDNLSSGIYFYTLNAGNFIKTKKMILLR
ncbi:MAG: YCF48-related protein [Ignavibacteriaceae bacterium]